MAQSNTLSDLTGRLVNANLFLDPTELVQTLPVSCVGPHTEPGADLPHLDGLVPAAADDVVTGGEEGDAAHVVVVPMHGLDTFVGLEVPQLDRHVSTTGSQQLSIFVQSNILTI